MRNTLQGSRYERATCGCGDDARLQHLGCLSL